MLTASSKEQNGHVTGHCDSPIQGPTHGRTHARHTHLLRHPHLPNTTALFQADVGATAALPTSPAATMLDMSAAMTAAHAGGKMAVKLPVAAGGARSSPYPLSLPADILGLKNQSMLLNSAVALQVRVDRG